MKPINHIAIIATTWERDEVDRLEEWIGALETKWERSLFMVEKSQLNNYRTIVMLPDGTKKEWAKNKQAEILRNKFINELEKGNYRDGSSPWEFVEVGFGEYGQKILRGIEG